MPEPKKQLTKTSSTAFCVFEGAERKNTKVCILFSSSFHMILMTLDQAPNKRMLLKNPN